MYKVILNQMEYNSYLLIKKLKLKNVFSFCNKLHIKKMDIFLYLFFLQSFFEYKFGVRNQINSCFAVNFGRDIIYLNLYIYIFLTLVAIVNSFV